MGMTIALTVIGVVLVAAFAGMVWSWRRRVRAQSGLRLPAGAPDPERLAPGAAMADVLGQHVATTFAGRPLDRVAVHGLGFRGRAELIVAPSGVRVGIVGARPLWIPVDHLRGAGAAGWTLDRAVEPGGLTVVAWAMDSADGRVEVESAFRFDPAASDRVIAAVTSIVERAHAES